MATLEAKVDEYTKDQEKGLLCIAMLGIDGSGKEIYSHTSGVTSLDSSSARNITHDSIFRLASCTKLLTSIAALRLVQAGKLDLDDVEIIQKHLPELCAQEVFTSKPGEELKYEKRKKDITLRHLLTHSSGVSADILSPQLQAYRKSRGEVPLALIGPIVEAFSLPLLFQPGEGWTYGGGLDMTALLITRISGISLGEFLRKEVFDIVGCDARIGYDRQVQGSGDAVMVVTRGENGLKEWTVKPQKEEMGGGGLLSSSHNFIRVLADLISEEPKLLTRKWIDELFSPQFSQGDKSLEALPASAPMFTMMMGPLTSSLSPKSFNHGLGGLLLTEDDADLGKTKGTMAWGGAFSCLWFANREARVAGFFGSSLFPPQDEKCGEVMGEFVREIWRKVGK